LPTSSAVPSLPFLTTPTVSSADDRVGLLHPTADHGVHPVSCRPMTSLPSSDIPHGRLTLRSLPLPTRWTPSPSHSWLVHRMSCPSRGWPSSPARQQAGPREKKPPPQGFPDRESVARPPRCHDDRPVAPLGFPPTPGSHLPLLPASQRDRSHPWTCSAPDRSREPPATRPAEANRADRRHRRPRDFRTRSPHRSEGRRTAGPRDLARGFLHRHPRSKLRAGAAAFQATPLPMRP